MRSTIKLTLSTLTLLSFPIITHAQTDLGKQLASDPQGNMLALTILLGLAGSLFAALLPLAFPHIAEALHADARWPIGMAGLLGLGLSFALLRNTGGGYVTILALALITMFSAVLWRVLQVGTSMVGVGLLALLMGAGIAAFLAFGDGTTLACGTMGDCSSIPLNVDRHLFGIPAGLWGLTGFAALGLLWGIGRIMPNAQADRALYVLLIVGTVIALYLVFLEPFVMDAVCWWCLAAGLLMVIALWALAPEGWRGWQSSAIGNDDLPESILNNQI